MKITKIIGLQKEKVKLSPYNPIWEKLYKKEEKLIRSALKDHISDIQHIGSTSVPGAKAKPIIDIAIGVKNVKNLEKITNFLELLNYKYEHNAKIKGRYFFTKEKGVYATHHLHIEKINGRNWKNQIIFRDYLKKHKKAVKEYNELKEELAKKYENDRKKYVAGKDNFIKSILKK